MYETRVLEQFRHVPVFSLADVSQIIQNRSYAKNFMKRMIAEGKIKKIKRGFYTLQEDPFIVSTYVIRPSYISSVSALAFHRMITQIPNKVFCLTEKPTSKITFISDMLYFHTDYFFGFRHEAYESFSVPVAVPEKAVIDSVGIVPVSVFEEAFADLDAKTLLKLLEKIKKGSIVKRIGYLAERNGFDVYENLKKFLNNKYVLLDPLAKNKGNENIKWKVIANG